MARNLILGSMWVLGTLHDHSDSQQDPQRPISINTSRTIVSVDTAALDPGSIFSLVRARYCDRSHSFA